MLRGVLALLIVTSATSAMGATSATGVAFVHGTGQQTDAYDDYWLPAMVDSVRSGLVDQDNYVVINCDFNQYMWDDRAAGCLATQLTDFLAAHPTVTDLLVITHSNGGNVMRWILSNPTYDSRYPAIIDKVRRVDALAPSSAGTPLADAVIAGNVFDQEVGWLLGDQSDAVRQQQTAQMAYYNENSLYGTDGRPALPKDFRAIVGSAVDATPLDPDATCGGYLFNVGLKVTQAWLTEGCNDGFIECASASAAGEVWFQDTSRTTGAAALSHNQSRRACFGLDLILRDDL